MTDRNITPLASIFAGLNAFSPSASRPSLDFFAPSACAASVDSVVSGMTISPNSFLLPLCPPFLMSLVMFRPSAAPKEKAWNPPESVMVGPDQFMNAPNPPAFFMISSPGCRYR